MNTPLPKPYATHYRNKGGASVWHKGPSNRLDADKSASIEYPLVHFTVDVFTADQVRQAQREAVAAAVPDGYKLVMVPEEIGPEPDWEDVRYQSEAATGLKIDRAAFSIVIREVRRWLAASPEVKPLQQESSSKL